jgi:transposase
MRDAPNSFSAWLAQAQVSESRLTPDQRGVLLAVYHFRQQQGDDSYSTRLLTHFLLHCHSGLKVAALARLLGVSRPTASRQQGMSSKQAVQQAHHRMDGRPYGKLLPRYAGAILEFRLTHPDASRADLIDFIDARFGVHVSRIALYHFLKKFGLDRIPATPVPPAPPPGDPVASPQLLPVMPVTVLTPPFSSAARSTRVSS